MCPSLPGFVYQRRVVPRRTISLPTCVWRWTASPAPCRWVCETGYNPVEYSLPVVPLLMSSYYIFGVWCIVFFSQGYLPPTKNGVEPKRPSRPINITSLVRLSTTVPNTIVVSWTLEIGRVRRELWRWKSSDSNNCIMVELGDMAYFCILLCELNTWQIKVLSIFSFFPSLYCNAAFKTRKRQHLCHTISKI